MNKWWVIAIGLLAIYHLRGRNGGLNGAAPTRPSCVECVMKHLGSAWVLMTECRDGYDYEPLAVGHLAQAEDESQAWPEVHMAIRNARKLYQQNGVIPNFMALTRLVRVKGKEA